MNFEQFDKIEKLIKVYSKGGQRKQLTQKPPAIPPAVTTSKAAISEFEKRSRLFDERRRRSLFQQTAVIPQSGQLNNTLG